jgi:hypothetical protein
MGTGIAGRIVRSLLMVVLLAGCKMDLRSDAEKQQEIQQQQQGEQQRQEAAITAALKLREQQEAEKKAFERKQLLAQPDGYLEASDFSYRDKGIINDYRQLIGVRVLNKSKYAVTDLKGEARLDAVHAAWLRRRGGDGALH